MNLRIDYVVCRIVHQPRMSIAYCELVPTWLARVTIGIRNTVMTSASGAPHLQSKSYIVVSHKSTTLFAEALQEHSLCWIRTQIRASHGQQVCYIWFHRQKSTKWQIPTFVSITFRSPRKRHHPDNMHVCWLVNAILAVVKILIAHQKRTSRTNDVDASHLE